MNKLAVANELFLYIIILLVLGCECLTTTSSSENEILGWLIIAVITLTIHINLITVLTEAWSHIKLLYTKLTNFRAKSKNAQVMPNKMNISTVNIEQSIVITDYANKAAADVEHDVIMDLNALGDTGNMQELRQKADILLEPQTER